MRPQNILVGIVGVLVGLALAICFFRVANLAFHLLSFAVWIGVGLLITAVVYSLLMARLRGRS